MRKFIFKGVKAKEISFPLGGIGTGCIGLAGNGQLIDWEIFNRPNKKSLNGFSHFAIKAESEGKLLDARVLNGDILTPYTGKQLNYEGKFGESSLDLYGFGVSRGAMAGAPHFKETEFEGEYPIARVRFKDEYFPGEIEMTAFNPFIPLNDKDSSIPGAFFEIEVANTYECEINYSVCLSVNNPLPKSTTINSFTKVDEINLIKLYSNKYKGKEPEFGDITIATDATDTSYQEYWYRSRWFDNLEVYWHDLTTPGKFKNRTSDQKEKENPEEMCLLAAHICLKPGEKRKVRFVITWNFPNCNNYWNPEKINTNKNATRKEKIKTWKNYYASLFEDSTKSAVYCLENWERLYNETLEFKNALFSSSLPFYALDAVTANISTLKAPTVLRLEDGSLYGFEGCLPDAGCCEGSCTHVWNYAYALPFLFPKLERSMRDLDFKYNQREDGRMSFRLQLPLGRERWDFHACVDGQFGGVVKAYRDWKISGDSKWLKANWDRIKKSIEYAWAESDEDKWDPDKKGIIEGRQHHTLDMELFGPNSWLTGFYLAALKAGTEIAEYFGEKEKAEEYEKLFLSGKKYMDENLFNGEYYFQMVDLKEKSLLDGYSAGVSVLGGSTEDAYWNTEACELKYQIAEGCGIDQVIAQWHANICGLGEIFDNQQTKRALQSIYKYNFKKDMRNHFNACRNFSLNDESGLVICSWPEEKYKPAVPIPYAEETMTGFEYQAAVHMIQEGLIDEGLEIVKAVRDRYDGEKRNPWNEFECGSNYARSMASYALLTAFSGFEFDMVKGMIGFNPIMTDSGKFKCFWSLDSGWGTFEIEGNIAIINVIYGELNINIIKLPFIKDKHINSILYDDRPMKYNKNNEYIQLNTFTTIRKGEAIKIKIS